MKKIAWRELYKSPTIFPPTLERSLHRFQRLFAGTSGGGGTTSVAYLNVTPVSMSGTVETQLMGYTLPANFLSTNGYGIKITAHFCCTTSAGGKNMAKIYFGSTLVASALVNVNANADSCVLEAYVYRTGAATQTAWGTGISGQSGASTVPGGAFAGYSSPSETLANAIPVVCRGVTVDASHTMTQLSLLIGLTKTS